MFGRSRRSSRKENIQDAELRVEGIDVPVVLKRHSRARRLILRINESRREVHVTLPDHCESDEAVDFIKRNTAWLKKRLDKLPEGTAFVDGAEVPFRGIQHRVCFVERNPGREVVVLKRDELPVLYVSGGDRHGPRRLQDWLKKQAILDLRERVNFHAGRLQLTPKRISVRDQKSRWGSCSSSGSLSFSWRLVLAPGFVLDYVAAHEVAHLAEMNHGPNFWKLVKQTMPDYERSQAWLKVHGAGLHRYGV